MKFFSLENFKSLSFQFVLSRISTSRLALPLIMASIVGILTGFLIVGFVWLVEYCQYFFFEIVPTWFAFLGRYAIVMVPVLGALIVGVIVTFICQEAKGHGVPEVMKAVTLRGGKIRPVVIFGKLIASALAIGSGASVGREGPIVQAGSALGSNVARFFKLSESRTRNFVACGAAAGIAGVFNAPIAGVMFSLEVILRDFGARALSTVVVAAVSGSIISRIFLGESPAFIVPIYELESSQEIFLYLILGGLSAITAILFMQVLHRSEELFDKWKFTTWLKPAVGALVLGLVGVFFPQVFGSGLHTIEEVLHGKLGWQMLIALVFLKIFATSLSLGSGTSGGVFAPALFIGAVLGGAVGHFFNGVVPFEMAPPGAYALVGMASVFSGAAHAPVTAILIVFEMTGDYRMILPIMIATVVSTSIAQLLQRESIYTMKLKDKGIDIDSLEEVKVLGALLVIDAMDAEFMTVPQNMTAQEIAERMSEEKDKTFYVVNNKGELVGVIEPSRLQDVLFEEGSALFIADDIASPCIETCLPDDPLIEVAHQMMRTRLTQVPVLDPVHPNHVLGVLKSEQVFRAYTELSVKRSDLVTRLEHQDSSANGTTQIHFDIPSRSKLIGKSIQELGIPHGVVLTIIQRKGKTVVPEGATVLKSKDKVWAVVVPESEEAFHAWLDDNGLTLYSFF